MLLRKLKKKNLLKKIMKLKKCPNKMNKNIKRNLKVRKIQLKLNHKHIHQTINNNRSMIYQKMLEIFQMLLMIINKETLFQQDKSMIHNQRLSFKITLCNQEMGNIQSCFQKNQRNMIFLKMLETYQMQPTIINKETLFQLVRGTTHNQRPISKIMLCNQEMESIQ